MKFVVRMIDRHLTTRGVLKWQKYTKWAREKQLWMNERGIVHEIDQL